MVRERCQLSTAHKRNVKEREPVEKPKGKRGPSFFTDNGDKEKKGDGGSLLREKGDQRQGFVGLGEVSLGRRERRALSLATLCATMAGFQKK